MNIKSMIRRGLMDASCGIGIVEHPLVEAAKRQIEAEALAMATKKPTKKKATKKEK